MQKLILILAVLGTLTRLSLGDSFEERTNKGFTRIELIQKQTISKITDLEWEHFRDHPGEPLSFAEALEEMAIVYGGVEEEIAVIDWESPLTPAQRNELFFAEIGGLLEVLAEKQARGELPPPVK